MKSECKASAADARQTRKADAVCCCTGAQPLCCCVMGRPGWADELINVFH
jgi:hypothetical protein